MRLKLRDKFLIPTITLIIIGMATLTFVSYFYSRNTIENMAETEISQIADSASHHIAFWIKEIKLNIGSWSEEATFRTAVPDTFLGKSSRETASERLLAIKGDYDLFEHIILFDTAGKSIAATVTEAVGKLRVADMHFFQKSLAGKTFISQVIKSRITGLPIFMVSAPLKLHGKEVVGVIAGSISMDYFNKRFVEPVRVGKTGYAYIYNTDGLIVAHPDKKKWLSANINETDFGPEMMKKKSGLTHYGMNKMAAFKKIEGKNWSIAVVAHTDELLAPVKKTGYVISVLSLLIVILMVMLIFFIVRMVTKPLDDVTSFAKMMTEGNLCAVVDVENRDEIGEMATNLNKAADNLKNMISELADTGGILEKCSRELSSVATEMSSSAQDMKSRSDTVATASLQIDENVGTVASAVRQYDVSVSDIASMTEEMSSAFTDVADSAKKTAHNVTAMARMSVNISEQVSDIASASEEMSASMNEVAKHTAQASRISQNANERTDQISSRMEALVASSGKIGKIVELIKDIADQTNMLALNATIEAAGAGDAGRGFAVVAGEIKELAKQSAEATDEISDQIEEIQASVRDAVRATGEVDGVIDEIADINEMIAASAEEQTSTAGEISKSVTGTASTVRNMADSAEESAGLVREIARLTDELSKTVAEVARNIDELMKGMRTIARSTDEAAQEISGISENIRTISTVSEKTSLGASQTHASSEELVEITERLNSIVSRFKLKD